MHDLKGRTLRGGLARFGALGATFVLRMGAIMALARLLSPKDFGLVGMVMAFTGVLSFIRDFGLSSATVQRTTISEEQSSTLFWINILIGALLGLITVAMAPAIAAFYGEPRLFGITAVLALGFLFNAAGTQHAALLQRQMRWTTLAVISVVSLMVGAAIAIAGAEAGYGYWALVWMSIASPLAGTLGSWLTAGWVPGMPRRHTGVRSLILFGVTLTLRGLVTFVAYNADKVLIGRFWGAQAIGIYGRAYQLVNMPTEHLNSAVGEVAFAALSRLQNDPVRLKNYFLKGFSLVLGLTLPITLVCVLFSDDLVFVVLGPQWKEAAAILRLLAPAMAVYAIINPLEWLIYSIGLGTRSLKISLVFAPFMITAYLIGLPYGPAGVAFAYSAAMTLWLIPHTLWCVRGTVISLRDILLVMSRPVASGALAGGVAFGARVTYGQFFPPLARLVLESSVLLIAFFGVLLFAAGQKSLYLDLLRGLRSSSVAGGGAEVGISAGGAIQET
jgi:O-antigen/teichoic acid export membrane protein